MSQCTLNTICGKFKLFINFKIDNLKFTEVLTEGHDQGLINHKVKFPKVSEFQNNSLILSDKRNLL